MLAWGGEFAVIVDEIDKVDGTPGRGRGVATLSEALLSLLEPATAQAWECPSFRIPFDMSWISWVMTANSLDTIERPLLSRCHVMEIGPIGIDHLCAFARKEGQRRGLSETGCDTLAEVIRRHDGRAGDMSLRTVLRLVEQALSLDGRPSVH